MNANSEIIRLIADLLDSINSCEDDEVIRNLCERIEQICGIRFWDSNMPTIEASLVRALQEGK